MRKRARTTATRAPPPDAAGDGTDVKRRRRMEKNRNSAQLSRMRRKAYVESLEQKVENLTDQIESMEARMDELKEENVALKEMLRGDDDTPAPAPPAVVKAAPVAAVLPMPPPPAEGAGVCVHELVSQPVESSDHTERADEARRASKYNLRRMPRKSAAYSDCVTAAEESLLHKRAMEESIRKSYEILRQSMPRRRDTAAREVDVVESDEDAVFPAVDVGFGVGVDSDAFRADPGAGGAAGGLEDVLGGSLRTPRTPAAFDFFHAPAALSMFDDAYAPLFV